MLTLKGSPASFSVSDPLVGVEANVPAAVYVMTGADPPARLAEIKKQPIADTAIPVASVVRNIIVISLFIPVERRTPYRALADRLQIFKLATGRAYQMPTLHGMALKGAGRGPAPQEAV